MITATESKTAVKRFSSAALTTEMRSSSENSLNEVLKTKTVNNIHTAKTKQRI